MIERHSGKASQPSQPSTTRRTTVTIVITFIDDVMRDSERNAWDLFNKEESYKITLQRYI